MHVFDRATLEHVTDFALPGGANEVLSTPDGSMIWIVNGEGNTVTLLDTDTYDISSVRVGVGPEHTVITPDHTQIWVSNDGSGDVSVIDIAARAALGSIVTGSGHHKIAFATDDAGQTSFAYVSNLGDSSITPVTSERSVLVNVTGVGPAPHGIDYSDVTNAVYNCSGDAENSIEVIATRDDASTPDVDERHTVIARVSLPSRCRYLRVAADGEHAYALLSSNQLVQLRLADLQVSLFDTGSQPSAVEIVDTRAYVANVGDIFVSVIDLTGMSATEQIAVGNATDPSDTNADGSRALRLDGTLLFVTNTHDGTVSVIDTTTNLVVRTWPDIAGAASISVAGPEGGTTYPR